MNYTKAMMTTYFSVYVVIFVSYIIDSLIPNNKPESIGNLLTYLLLVLVALTFGFMYFAAKKGIGRKYAVKNTILAVLMTSIVLGFLLWPLLVRNEIKKKKLLFEQGKGPQAA